MAVSTFTLYVGIVSYRSFSLKLNPYFLGFDSISLKAKILNTYLLVSSFNNKS